MSKSYILSRMDWAKAYRDYEELKVGNENLLNDGDKLQEYIIGWDNATVNQIKKDKLYHIKTIGGTNVLKALINMRSGDYVQQLERIIQENRLLSVVFEIKNNMNSAMYVSLNGFKRVDGTGLSVRTEVPPNYDGVIYLESSGFVNSSSAFQIQYASKNISSDLDFIISPIKISVKSMGRYTPSPKDINAQPFPAQVAHDMYQATEGNWVKAEQDYEVLKVGKTNLLPEVGEQVISGLDSFNHSSHIGIYDGIISNTINHKNGKQFFFDIKEKVKKNDIFTLSCDFSNNETNLYVVYLYDAEKKIIDTGEEIKTEVVSRNIEMIGNANSFYKGFISHGFNNGSSFCFEIVGDKVKFISIGVGMYAHTYMTMPLKVSNWKLERGDASTPFTPSPQSINASPFTVKLANDYYQQQTEITELRNAILQLGGQ